MARLWFISAPLYSHTDWGGFLATAQALQRRGHDLLWLSEGSLSGALRQHGIPFRAIDHTGWLWPPPPAPDPATLSNAEAVKIRYKRALDTWLSEDLVTKAVEALLRLADEIGAPDAIVSDPFLSAAAIAADALDLPLIICGWPAQASVSAPQLLPVQRVLSSDSQRRLQRLTNRFGVKGIYFSPGAAPAIHSDRLHINYFTRGWYQSELETLLPQNAFVGGLAASATDPPPDWLRDIPADRPLGLVSLGTLFTGDLAFYSVSAQALARAGIIPIVTLGWQMAAERIAELKRALPGGTRLLRWAPYEHIFPRCQIVIHHGGLGTTHRSLVHGLRQIVVPQAADQRIQARRAAEAKVGLHLTAQDLRQGRMGEAVNALLAADWVAENARRLSREMAAAGGPGALPS